MNDFNPKNLGDLLNKPPEGRNIEGVVIYLEFADISNDFYSGFVLSHLYNWTATQEDPCGWIGKSLNDWHGIEPKFLKAACKNLSKLGLIQYKRAGGVFNYKVEYEVLLKALKSIKSK